ncbi:hypothetical protein [Enterococcus sp.]|uniref:hypothetical protein n=1 Tax=Enterococcus sp. TaxID=35783 RepID=UPI0029094DF7|nr:hypothetical protein [Enterococcus sp.]MDU5335739.1 hypothetical protein [Enterococcus sp.]
MGYEELIGTLYDTARKTEDEELQERLYDLGWTVKKCGIRDESEDSEEEIHFTELLRRLESMAEQAKELADIIVLNDLKGKLSSNGIDGYHGKYY